jgi:hypothetical protein
MSVQPSHPDDNMAVHPSDTDQTAAPSGTNSTDKNSQSTKKNKKKPKDNTNQTPDATTQDPTQPPK